MAKEIERKFLVRDEGWRCEVAQRMSLCDGVLISTRQRKVRIRIADERATLAIKDKRNGAQRNEFEYAIPIEDARELLDQHCTMKVAKTRNLVEHGGHKWEIDEYHQLGVTIAEIELARDDEPFEKPPWPGPEVTNNGRYRKRNLVARHIKASRKDNPRRRSSP